MIQSNILLFKSWSLLEIETNELATDEHQAYTAGYLEGKLTVNNSKTLLISLNSEYNFYFLLERCLDNMFKLRTQQQFKLNFY